MSGDLLGKSAELFARTTAMAQSYDAEYIRGSLIVDITVIPGHTNTEVFAVDDDFQEAIPFNWIVPFPDQLRSLLGHVIEPERGDIISLQAEHVRGQYVVVNDQAGMTWSPLDQTQRMIVVHTEYFSRDPNQGVMPDDDIYE